ncbi:ATP-binding cassette sub-family G member 1-like [Neocloeon triangulifer]|uniref:ATP-binding cassette sub-family G member 1-like n=1 Tax=Neocloeon triangulifer TaxID=2078957 RepID=UPI00286F37B1|nr:ATP-binding cassette sub-family G member 1-like [Neocloeon triangulifer]
MPKGGSEAAGPPPPDRALLSYLPKRQSLDITFRNVQYKALALSLNKRPAMKQILFGVSGEFHSGQLTAILGPSGAGKSTLLNILAGYVTRNVTGTIEVNGEPRDLNKFGRQACYIMQENELRPLLTAREAMTYAAKLKLGGGSHAPSNKAISLQIGEIFETLGLTEHQNTRAGLLSGGQRRRLSIALELLNNPPIMFLDEPTTGLDSASCAQCIELLRYLARGGRTIIITIHQPSARIFERFDSLYAVANGRCIYKGSPQALLPFLASKGLECPAYHNPADFLLEVACGEHGHHGLADEIDRLGTPVVAVPETSSGSSRPFEDSPAKLDNIQIISNLPKITFEERGSGKQSSLFKQFLLLYVRNVHILSRDCKPMAVRLFCHLGIAWLFGYLYRGVGNDADKVLANWVYIYGTCLFVMYTGKMAVTLQFPLEISNLTREHFNKWYSLGPYLLSIFCIEIPFQIACALGYLSISYHMTGQPMEVSRLVPFFVLCVLTSFTAQAFGFFIGATLPVTIAVFIGPSIGVLLSIFGFCIIWRDTPWMFRWLYNISYFRAAFVSAVYTLYGNNRGTLPCKEMYCHFTYARKFLAEMDVPPDTDVVFNCLFVASTGVVMYVATYAALWIKLHVR